MSRRRHFAYRFAHRFAHRFATLALSLPMWISMVLTGGEWCLMPGAHAALPALSATALPPGIAGNGDASVDGHVARGAQDPHEATAHEGAATVEQVHGPASAHVHASAHVDLAPTTSPESSHHGADDGACGPSMVCGVAVAAAVRVLVDRAPPPPLRPLLVGVDRPTSVTFAPEIPPPRA